MLAERTCLQFYRAKEVLKTVRILYKNHMLHFFHRRKIDDLDGLSNKANEAIRTGKWQEAETVCQRLREAFPEEIDADDRLAQLHQAQKNYVQALPYAQAALDKARRNPDKFAPELIADLLEQVEFIQEEIAK